MRLENYVAETTWLNAYFDDCDHVEISLDAIQEMDQHNIDMQELLFIFRDGEVRSAERGREGCIFTIFGRNCDEERIEIIGGFNSEMQMVSVFSVKKL